MSIADIENFMRDDLHKNLFDAQKYPIVGVFPAAAQLLISVTEAAVGALLFLGAGIAGSFCLPFSVTAADNCFDVAWLGAHLAKQGTLIALVEAVNILTLGFAGFCLYRCS